MSHHVRHNPTHISHMFVSQAFVLKEVMRHFRRYNIWQMSHHLRSNTLTTTVRPNPISVHET
jgi:hypothetical protein